MLSWSGQSFARWERAAAALAFFLIVGFASQAFAVCGDLTGDETVLASDALTCLRGAVGSLDLQDSCEPASNCGPEFPPCGDVTSDGKVLAGDCLSILRAAVGLVDLDGACDCSGLQLCGNGVLDEGEGCDDGGRISNDGCSNLCEVEPDPCQAIEAVSGRGLALEHVASIGAALTHIAAAPEDPSRLYVARQDGIVRIIEDGVLSEELFLDLSEATALLEAENGLLGLAFHPDFASNHRFFVNYTDLEGDTVVSRFEVDPQTGNADPQSEKKLLVIEQIDGLHNGGQSAFGPDGYLWVGMGDGNGSPGGDTADQAQDDGSLLGKMLRLDVDVELPPYWAVPASNPDAFAPGALALIWAEGLRNPWRFSFDRETGDLWLSDVGQNAFEEINVLREDQLEDAPFQFGWNCCEGSEAFEGAGPECTYSCEEQVIPRRELPHSGGDFNLCSITGGFVYRGRRMPDLQGSYFFADFCSGRVFEDSGAPLVIDRSEELGSSGGASLSLPSTFGEDACGELYIGDYSDGDVFRLVPEPSVD